MSEEKEKVKGITFTPDEANLIIQSLNYLFASNGLRIEGTSNAIEQTMQLAHLAQVACAKVDKLTER